jgi:hypothetical protein
MGTLNDCKTDLAAKQQNRKYMAIYVCFLGIFTLSLTAMPCGTWNAFTVYTNSSGLSGLGYTNRCFGNTDIDNNSKSVK